MAFPGKYYKLAYSFYKIPFLLTLAGINYISWFWPQEHPKKIYQRTRMSYLVGDRSPSPTTSKHLVFAFTQDESCYLLIHLHPHKIPRCTCHLYWFDLQIPQCQRWLTSAAHCFPEAHNFWLLTGHLVHCESLGHFQIWCWIKCPLTWICQCPSHLHDHKREIKDGVMS